MTTPPDPEPLDIVPAELLAAIRAMSNAVVVSHVVPDADALGSMLGFARGWHDPGSRFTASLPEGSLSQRLQFLWNMAGVPEATPEDFSRADGFIVVDTAKKPRCNIAAVLKDRDWSSGRPVINIDHHETNTKFGDINWIRGTASSASELVYDVLETAGRPIDAVTASLLYAGIQTDTLGFSLEGATPSALRAAARLVERGARVADLGERLGRSQSHSEFALLRIIYDHTEVVSGGRIAYSFATHEDIHGSGCTAADIDEQINVPRSLNGVQLAMLFTEGRRGKTRINFRSSGPVTVTDLAGEFGGGGHRHAAGAVLDCGVREAIDRVVPRAIESLSRFPSA